MKTYEVKYDIGQEVYIISDKKLFKSRINKIRVLEQQPYKKYDSSKQTHVDMDGIEIHYLVLTKEVNCYTEYDWYCQDDVFETKQEVFRKIM